MKKRICCYIAAVTLMMVLGCNNRDHRVVVIEKTKSYHISECPRVNMAHTQTMTIAEAQGLNYKPCKDCRPDRGPADKQDSKQ
jgi:uncharacterized lipoprotein NlpE involved in copper resistance